MDRTDKKSVSLLSGHLREGLVIIGVLIFAVLQYYNYPQQKALEDKYPKIYNEQLARQSTPQAEEMALLLKPITQATIQPIDQQDLFRKYGSSASATHKYKNPSERTLQDILKEVESQGFWMPNYQSEPADGNNILYKKEFCHQEYTLAITNEKTAEGSMLFVSAYWQYDSDCRKLALGYKLG